jgi:hypothetical protein
MWQEKRSAQRHVIVLPIQYREIESSEAMEKTDQASVLRGHTKNVSEQGLLFLSRQPFKKGTILEVTFPLKDKLFKILGSVVYSMVDPDTTLYRTSIQFQKPDSMFKLKIAEQIYLINQYQQHLSREESRTVSDEEAAEKWIQHHSAEFSKFYEN